MQAKQKGPDPQLKELWDAYMADPKLFLFGNAKLKGLVRTLDEHAKTGEDPIKAFPRRPHLEVLTDLWANEQLLAVAKSRQMLVSWWALSMVMFECYHPGKRWGVVCKKFDAADELLDRIWGMIGRIPPALCPKATRKQGLITIQHPSALSQIHAFAQDSDEARSKTFSGILIDEAAFCSFLDDLLVGCMPTVMSGGRMVLVSTPNFIETFAMTLSDGGRIDLA